MVISSLSERLGAGPGRFKACWITADPFIVSSTMVKMVVRTVALSSICSALLVCLYCLQTEAYYSSHSLSATSTKRTYMARELGMIFIITGISLSLSKKRILSNEYTDLEKPFHLMTQMDKTSLSEVLADRKEDVPCQ